MSEKDNHITDLFRKYLHGDINRIEQKALDQKVQEDAYVKDAKEGIDQISKVNIAESLNTLDDRLSARIQKNQSNRGIAWLSIAAGIAILVTATLLIWNPFENNTNVAQAESTVTKEKISVSKNTNERETNVDQEIDFSSTDFGQGTVSDIAVNTEDLIAAEQNEKIAKPKTIAKAKQESKAFSPSSPNGRNKANTANTYYLDGVKVEGNLFPESDESIPSSMQTRPSQIAAPESITDNPKANDKDLQNNIEAAKESSVIALNDAMATEDQDSQSSIATRKAKSASPPAAMASNLKTVTGLVKDENGALLIGVSVYDTQNDIGTVTNIDGRFTLDVPVDVQELTISYTGYEDLIVVIPESNEIIASINQGNAVLSEVVITDLELAKRESRSTKAATPVNGNATFKKYIKENINVPSQARNAGIRGKVMLLFNVDSAGNPIDIEVKKSLGYGCDEEAIRLLSEGPQWTQGTLSEKNIISIRFR